MNFHSYHPEDNSQIVELFVSVFTASEGKTEGEMIGNLTKELLETTKREDLHVFLASNSREITGCIFATRMPGKEEREVFLIAPVAVRTEYQSRGIGQNLLKFGIEQLNSKGAKILVTYGDPAFYSKVGFLPISQDQIEAPFSLTQPEGWLAQSLDGKPINESLGKCSCVPAFNHETYW